VTDDARTGDPSEDDLETSDVAEASESDVDNAAQDGVEDADESPEDGDSEPQPVAAPDTDPGTVSARRPASRWMPAVQWLLPIVLTGAAVGVHWWLNVPEDIVEAKGDQGAKAKAKPKGRKKPARGFDARDNKALERDFKRWEGVDFEGEPVHGKWARAYQSAISRAVVIARKAAFDGAPTQPRIMVAEAECRTVRCRFLLRSPFQQELPILDRALSRLEDSKGKVWRTYESEAIEAPEALPEDAPADEFFYRVTVTFVSDEIDSASFVIPPDPDATAATGSGDAASSGDSGAQAASGG
jgi:hypothetical protein